MLLQYQPCPGAEDVVVPADPLDDLVEVLRGLHVDDRDDVLVAGDLEHLGDAVVPGQLPGYLLGVGVHRDADLHQRLDVLRARLDGEPAYDALLDHLVDPAAHGPLRYAELVGYLDERTSRVLLQQLYDLLVEVVNHIDHPGSA